MTKLIFDFIIIIIVTTIKNKNSIYFWVIRKKDFDRKFNFFKVTYHIYLYQSNFDFKNAKYFFYLILIIATFIIIIIINYLFKPKPNVEKESNLYFNNFVYY